MRKLRRRIGERRENGECEGGEIERGQRVVRCLVGVT